MIFAKKSKWARMPGPDCQKAKKRKRSGQAQPDSTGLQQERGQPMAGQSHAREPLGEGEDATAAGKELVVGESTNNGKAS
ncbi:MAG: hypothetical protein MUD08_16870 [Cytophagales bacterium]|jgi:hypothetical protein|nr:hypothetical protein [Cytophagales bacterium]